jgi:hypothetical protein
MSTRTTRCCICCHRSRECCSRKNPHYRKCYTTVCQCGCCSTGCCPPWCRKRCSLCESHRRPNPWRARWYQTICPCYRDPFAPVTGSHDIFCFRMSTMVMVALWCLIGGLLTMGGLFFFFSFIFEFVKHKFLLSEGALVLGIFMFLIGFYICSRILRAARDAGLSNDRAFAWAPVYCPGFVCHMCCTSKKERVDFVKRRCNSNMIKKTLEWCCCIDSDRKRNTRIKFNRIFQNEDEWEEEIKKEKAVQDAIEMERKRDEKIQHTEKVESLLEKKLNKKKKMNDDDDDDYVCNDSYVINMPPSARPSAGRNTLVSPDMHSLRGSPRSSYSSSRSSRRTTSYVSEDEMEMVSLGNDTLMYSPGGSEIKRRKRRKSGKKKKRKRKEKAEEGVKCGDLKTTKSRKSKRKSKKVQKDTKKRKKNVDLHEDK